MKKNLTPHARRLLASRNQPPPTDSKLFVAGISPSLDEESLKGCFAIFGDIDEATIMHDKDTGESRGFGFVHFSNAVPARNCKNFMDGQKFLGRRFRIRFAPEKVNGGPSVTPSCTSPGDVDCSTS